MKWRIGPEDVAELCTVQADVLERASRLVKPGGRLVYATCSLLAVENEGTVEGFLTGHEDFRVLPVGEVWATLLDGDCPVEGPYLRLSPARHGTDGFFAAILERLATPAASTDPEDDPEDDPESVETAAA